MLNKLKLGLVALLLPLVAFAQSYPSPTFQNLTVNGTLSVTGAPTFTSPIPVASGGTGKTSISSNTLLYGAGTAALNTLGPLTNGQLVVGSTGAAPVAATLTGTPNQIVVTNGAGSITLSTPQNINSTSSPTFAGLTLSTTPLSVASGGTGLATLTAHSVLIGNGTTALTQVGPNATSGLALISQGSSADPAFGEPTGALVGIQVFTSTGTYTPTAGTNSVVVEVQAAGGGSGGIAATGASTVSASTGSGAGAYAKVRFTSGFSGVTVTIGAAGAAGAAGGAGGNASASSFGSLISCPGGNGTSAGAASGTGGGITSGAAQTAAPTISGGTTILSVAGAGTTPSILLSSTQALTFPGANSILGIGGIQGATTTSTAMSGSGYGSGASSAINGNSQAAAVGAAGRPAVVIVYEFS